jgi:Peptidase M16 inactive domain
MPYHSDVPAEALDELTLEGVRDAVESRLHPSNLEVDVAGDFDPEELEALLLRYMGTLKGLRPPPSAEVLAGAPVVFKVRSVHCVLYAHLLLPPLSLSLFTCHIMLYFAALCLLFFWLSVLKRKVKKTIIFGAPHCSPALPLLSLHSRMCHPLSATLCGTCVTVTSVQRPTSLAPLPVGGVPLTAVPRCGHLLAQ